MLFTTWVNMEQRGAVKSVHKRFGTFFLGLDACCTSRGSAMPTIESIRCSRNYNSMRYKVDNVDKNDLQKGCFVKEPTLIGWLGGTKPHPQQKAVLHRKRDWHFAFCTIRLTCTGNPNQGALALGLNVSVADAPWNCITSYYMVPHKPQTFSKWIT